MTQMNRHERRKAGKLVRMTRGEFLAMPSGCAWQGCHAMTNNPDKDGWSKMVLYSGKTEADFFRIDPRNMARDCVLCPDCASHLDGELLKFIGGPDRHLAGVEA